MESCSSPEKSIGWKSAAASNEDTDDSANQRCMKKNVVSSFTHRVTNSPRKALIIAAVFVTIGIVFLTSNNEKLDQQETLSLSQRMADQAAQRHSSKSSKSSDLSLYTEQNEAEQATLLDVEVAPEELNPVGVSDELTQAMTGENSKTGGGVSDGTSEASAGASATDAPIEEVAGANNDTVIEEQSGKNSTWTYLRSGEASPVKIGFLFLFSVCTVAFFAIALWTNNKARQRESSAKILEDDSSIWSENADDGATMKPSGSEDSSELVAFGESSAVAMHMQLSPVGEVSVVSVFTELTEGAVVGAEEEIVRREKCGC